MRARGAPGPRPELYEPAGVIVHHGTANAGHYWSHVCVDEEPPRRRQRIRQVAHLLARSRSCASARRRRGYQLRVV